jgi:uncharacterized protein (DUF1015 family)
LTVVADVRPFRAERYDEAKAGPLELLVAPPYDVISPAERDDYLARSPYNVVHLTLPDDYDEAGGLWRSWLADGVLAPDDEPALWWLSQTYSGPDGVVREREGIVCSLRLEPYESRVVLPHERTHSGPKEGRLKLLRAVRAEVEPIFLLYDGALEPPGGAPDVEVELEGVRNRLTRVEGEPPPELSAARLLIADGHHRYETALAYADEVGAGPDDPARFTMALLTDIADPGLVVLPTHRVMKTGVAVTGGEPKASLEETLASIRGRVAAGAYRDHRFQVLPLEGDLPVVELHEQVVDNLLGKRSLEENIVYTRDAAEAVRWVDEGVGVAAFFLDAPNLDQVLRLAREGKTMPQKATYFHPKPPSGMVFDRLERDRRL